MRILLKGGALFSGGEFFARDVLIDGDGIVKIQNQINDESAIICDMRGLSVFPGLTDVHVHLREPGYFYKEGIKTGTLAAAHGGFTTVLAMPNLFPAPDCPKNLAAEAEAIRRDACIRVIPYGTVTKGENGKELSDMDALAQKVAAFSDDGRGVQNGSVMLAAMKKAKSLSKIIAAHCEDNSLLSGGCIHDGEYARRHGLAGISSESEWRQLGRDLVLAEMTGCAYHVCHVSAKESVQLIRQAKKRGVNVTCETAPHYLVLTEDDLCDDGRFKMNPPLRTKADRDALIEGINDGTVDMIATDHAPHSAEEKSRGLKGSLMGITGLETAFPILYTKLVQSGRISLGTLIEKMSALPCERFGLDGGVLTEGGRADIFAVDLNEEYKISSGEFLSKGKSTPFEGEKVKGRIKLTIAGGKIVWTGK